MSVRRSRRAVAVVALAVALGLAVFVAMGPHSGGVPVHEELAGASFGLNAPAEEDGPNLSGYPSCASAIGCPYQSFVGLEEVMAEDETASNCVGFCFNAVVQSVDEQNWRIANVVMIGKNGKTTPATVERTRIVSSSRDPAAGGLPVRFACFDWVGRRDSARFESCTQMPAEK